MGEGRSYLLLAKHILWSGYVSTTMRMLYYSAPYVNRLQDSQSANYVQCVLNDSLQRL